jgi:3-deoxy-manno-octulosonate cytidylyltransferase (CMP-KDO synthetase)
MQVVCVIPARYASTRLPGKPLADVCGKPLIRWVYEKACAARKVRETFVATDDRRIFDAVQAFGGKALMTTGHYQSGTDRIADTLHNISCDAVVNLQGDEPLMHPEIIDQTIGILETDPQCPVATAMVKITEEKDYLSPSVVKVACASDGRVFYFSRSPIPSRARVGVQPEFSGYFGFKHLGLYVYRTEALLAFPALKPSFLEKIEQLEQLRFLENGFTIKIKETPHDSIGIDTPEDLEALRARLRCEYST